MLFTENDVLDINGVELSANGFGCIEFFLRLSFLCGDAERLLQARFLDGEHGNELVLGEP